MEIGFEILEKLEYNDVIVLKVIESNKMLKEVFYEEIKIPFVTLYESALNNTIDENTKDYMDRFFNSLILTDKKAIQNYKKFADELEITLNLPTEIEDESVEEISVEIEDVPEEKSGKPLKYPRRFGLEKVKEEIKKQGGEATLAQQAMIASNQLKNMNVRMNNLLIKAMHSEENNLSDADYLVIISTIRIVENKLKNVFKKK